MDKEDAMASASILWVDLRLRHPRPAAAFGLEPHYRLTGISDPRSLPSAIAAANPEVLCFEYDFPDLSGLHALRETKQRFQRLPILMLTAMHSEGLAVWAFRSGVRDYLVRPIEPQELQARLDALIALADRKQEGTARPMMAPDCLVPVEFRHRAGRETLTQRAISYIENHYHEPLYLDTVARVCGISASRFSRLFKIEQRATFGQYLIRFRIQKAMELLQRPGASVTEVALSVGFSSPSHLTHCFRRYGGTSPSDYRRRMALAPAIGGVALARHETTRDRA
jgi:YesN/AraC family two-component response regulator